MKVFLKQFFYLLDPQAKKYIPILILGFLLTSILDVIGIGLIGVFLGLLTNLNFFLGKFSQIWLLQTLTEKELLFYSGGTIIFAFIAKASLGLYIQKRVIYFCKFFSVRLKNRLITEYQNAPYIFHLQRDTNHLLATVHNNVNNYIDRFFIPTFNLISNGLIALLIMIFLFRFYPFVTSILTLMFIFIGLPYDVISKKQLSKTRKIFSFIEGKILKAIHQSLYGLIEIRVLGKEKYFSEQLNKYAHDDAKASAILTISQQLTRYLTENVIAIFVIGFTLISLSFNLEKGIIISTVGIFATAGGRLLPTLNQIMFAVTQLRAFSPTMNLLYEELVSLDSVHQLSDTIPSASQTEKLIFISLQIHGLYFKYPNSSCMTLKNINMEVHKGQSIGLIGPSGSGKSTLVNLILGLLRPNKGQLLVNNKPIQNFRAWLNKFAYIPQSIFLLDDSLRRNIAFGIEDNEIIESRIINALHMAQLTDVVKDLPCGLDTLIGENGVRLSGGQRQRVALARTFYHERDIIVMDEATSALDNETENEVINTIKCLKGNKTLIVIAHRLSTVAHCDTIYHLEHGQITASGSLTQVMSAEI